MILSEIKGFRKLWKSLSYTQKVELIKYLKSNSLEGGLNGKDQIERFQAVVDAFESTCSNHKKGS